MSDRFCTCTVPMPGAVRAAVVHVGLLRPFPPLCIECSLPIPQPLDPEVYGLQRYSWDAAQLAAEAYRGGMIGLVELQGSCTCECGCRLDATEQAKLCPSCNMDDCSAHGIANPCETCQGAGCNTCQATGYQSAALGFTVGRVALHLALQRREPRQIVQVKDVDVQEYIDTVNASNTPLCMSWNEDRGLLMHSGGRGWLSRADCVELAAAFAVLGLTI